MQKFWKKKSKAVLQTYSKSTAITYIAVMDTETDLTIWFLVAITKQI